MIFGKHINHYYLRLSWLILPGLLSLVFVDVLQLEIPRLYQMVINGLNTGEVEQDGVLHVFDLDFLLDHICLPMIGVLLGMIVTRVLWRLCLMGAAARMETDLRNRMFDHCKDLSRQYYHTNKVGNLMSLFTNDLDTVQSCFGWGLLMMVDASFLGFLALLKMWNMNPLLTVLSMIPMFFLIAIAVIVGRSMMKKWDVRQEAFSHLSDFSQESFSGIAVIKSFVKEFRELMAFRALNRANEDANVEYTKVSTLLRIFVTLFVESVICVILGFGGFLVYSDVFNAGELIEFMGYFTSIVWPVIAVSDLMESRSRGKASLKRISALLDAPCDVKDASDVKEVSSFRGDLEFRNLTFRYPGAEFDALRNISFHIQNGENVGLVGKTGSGKTTIVDLILRAYNVPDGTLFVDGMDVNQVRIRDVRDACAYVPQDNFLFSDTIARNISFGVEDESAEAIEHYADLADVHENISDFKDGYQTVLGERGVTVSGGQKQRISIARALMRNAPILILDDSVSAVDTKTEKVILDNLRKTRKGKTTILIAHRISTVESMDKIIYIDEGALVAVGTHEELCNTCPDYLKMVNLQKLAEEEQNNA